MSTVLIGELLSVAMFVTTIGAVLLATQSRSRWPAWR